MQGVHHLAIDIELKLPHRRIADADRRGAFIAREPRQLDFGQAAFARRAIHNLELSRISRHRPQKPIAPGRCLFLISGRHQGVESKGRVPQPAVSVIPVAHAAKKFRQRRRGRGDDPPCRGVGQGLEGDQRTEHMVLPFALVSAAVGPFLPPLFGVLHRLQRIDGLRGRLV